MRLLHIQHFPIKQMYHTLMMYVSFIDFTIIFIINFILQMNDHNKSSTYSTSSYEAYVPTPMSSSQQFITSEFSNMVPPTDSSSLINENTIPVTHVPQTGN